MIRFMLGLLLVYGAVGGLEMETATLAEGTGLALLGFALMIWALPKITKEA